MNKFQIGQRVKYSSSEVEVAMDGPIIKYGIVCNIMFRKKTECYSGYSYILKFDSDKEETKVWFKEEYLESIK